MSKTGTAWITQSVEVGRALFAILPSVFAAVMFSTMLVASVL